MKTFVLSLSVLFTALSLPAVAADEQRQAEVAKLGADVMPFNLKATIHIFAKSSDGGTQCVVARNAAETTQVRRVRAHQVAIKYKDADGGAELTSRAI